MKLENTIKTESQILESPYLSRKTGLKISILDYSCTSTGTHKLNKFVGQIQAAKRNEQGVFLFINPVIDSKKNSDGSGIDALELASAVHYPKSQVVCVVHSDKPYIKSEPINANFPNKRKRIVWGLNLREFWFKDQLENYFKSLMKGEAGPEFDKSQVIGIRNLLEEKGLDPFNCLDLTNLNDFNCYKYSSELINKLQEFDYLIGSAGTGERALGQIISLRDGKLKHIIVIPNGHPLDPFHRYEQSDSKRVQTSFRIKTHDYLLEESVERKDIIYKSAGLFFGGKQAKKLFVDKAIENDRLDIKSSSDGAIGFTILKEKENPEHENYFNDKWGSIEGLRIFNTYKASKNGFNYLYNTIIPENSKVCIVNTGCSNNLMLKKLIEEGIVK